MSDRVRVLTPVTNYTGAVGEYQFTNGKYDGEITEAARYYFETAGYTIEPLDEALKADAEEAKAKAEADLAAAEAADEAQQVEPVEQHADVPPIDTVPPPDTGSGQNPPSDIQNGGQS